MSTTLPMNLTLAKKNRHIKLGISTFSFPYAIGVEGFLPKRRMNLKELIDKAADLNVSVVQIGDNYPLHMRAETELSKIALYAAEKNIELEVGTRGCSLENLEKYIHISEILSSKLLRVVLDSKDDKPEFSEIVDRISKILPLLKEKQIILGIENHDRFSANVFAKLVQTLNSEYVGIVLDTVNSFACEESAQDVLEVLAPFTVNFHLKDYKISRVPNSMGLLVTGTIAGEGRLNVPEMLKVLRKKAPGDFNVILELWMQPEATIGRTIQKENEWVTQSISNIHRMFCESP